MATIALLDYRRPDLRKQTLENPVWIASDVFGNKPAPEANFKFVPSNVRFAESVKLPLAPAYVTRPLVNEESAIPAAVSVVPSNVKFAESVRLPLAPA